MDADVQYLNITDDFSDGEITNVCPLCKLSSGKSADCVMCEPCCTWVHGQNESVDIFDSVSDVCFCLSKNAHKRYFFFVCLLIINVLNNKVYWYTITIILEINHCVRLFVKNNSMDAQKTLILTGFVCKMCVCLFFRVCFLCCCFF